MRLKKSVYNIIIDKLENDKLLFFNSSKGSFGIMDAQTQTIYNNIENIDICDIKDDNIKKNIDIMRGNGFLIENDIDEVKQLNVLRNIARYNNAGRLSLTIAPTMNCNMNCPYCYEKKNSSIMSKNVQDSLIKFIKKRIQSKQISELSINWYGGEPLLGKETIKYLSNNFIKICKENDIKYFSSIITNGTLLDESTAVMLSNDCNISNCQITIDGIGEINNLRRRLKNGEGSFETIIKNIDSCKDIISIVIRMNVDKDNKESIDEFFNFYVEHKEWLSKVQIYLAPVSKLTEHCSFNDNICFSQQEFMKINLSFIKRILDIPNTKLNVNHFKPKQLSISCPSLGINTYVIDPEGYIYKCWNDVGIKEENIGDVFNDVTLNKKNIEWLTFDLSEECKSCNILPICQGGCPYIRMYNGNKPQCDYKVLLYKESLKMIYEDYCKKKQMQNAI